MILNPNSPIKNSSLDKYVSPNISRISMEFDMNTIQHLGISMYSRLPPVIAELVANSWDADSKNVHIKLNDNDDNNKSIIIEDDGIGLDISEINAKFLKIGRNRRIEEKNDRTSLGRLIIGKKGIGKLSIFGIAEEVIITTYKNYRYNKFKMSLADIKKSGHIYYPKHEINNQPSEKKSGTIIELRKIKRKSKFDIDTVANALSIRFLIFDANFKVSIIKNDDINTNLEIDNNLRFKNIEIEYEWQFPNTKGNFSYKFKQDVKGHVYSAKTTVSPQMKGIFLVARGKLVHSNDFYGLRTSQYSHSYITGWLNVDFIDDGPEIDLISTNRESLNWENELTSDLRDYLQEIIKFIDDEWRENRRIKRLKLIKDEKGIDVEKWISTLPKHEQGLAKKTTNIILRSEKISPEKGAELIGYIRDSFEFQAFKEFASEIEDYEEENQEEFVKFFKDWELTEAKEIYRLALVRIEAIKKFAQFIENDAKEVPTIHNFLKQFPWIKTCRNPPEEIAKRTINAKQIWA